MACPAGIGMPTGHGAASGMPTKPGAAQTDAFAPSLARRLPIVFIFVSAFFSCSRFSVRSSDDLGLAHRVGHRDQALVGGDLVVLGTSTRAGQERVEHLGGGGLVGHELVVLLLDPLDPGALLRLRRLSQLLERELEVLDVLTWSPPGGRRSPSPAPDPRLPPSAWEAPSPTSARRKAHRRARAGTVRAGHSLWC